MKAAQMYAFSLLFFFSEVGIAIAQKEKNIWYFGYHAGVDFNSGVPVALLNSPIRVWEGSASIADRNTGELLFYTDGMTVWDNTHTSMPNGTGLFGHWSSTQSALIVPVPGDSNKYYLFTIYNEGYIDPPNKGLNYSIVDMSLNHGKGDVTLKNAHLLDNTSEKVAGVPHSDGRSFWVITHTLNDNNWYAYKVSASGIGAPVISPVGDIEHSNSDENVISAGYLKISPNGKRLVAACFSSCSEVFDFDNATGVISNPISLECNTPVYGASFSPDNAKLYLGLSQYNISLSTPDSIRRSAVTVIGNNGGQDDYQPWALQLGPDGKIYLATFTNWLGRINDPNSLGLKCHFQSKVIDLGTGISRLGLPNFMDSYTDTGGIGGRTRSTEPAGAFALYPNPSLNASIATIYMPLAHIALGLYDVLGNKLEDVFSGDLSIDQTQITIDTHELTSGSYYLRLISPTGILTRKLVVIR